MMTTEAPQETTGASGKSRWFQLGLVFAGAVAPLIARWRSLQAADRAEALREQASERWNDAVSWAAQARPQETLQQSLRRLPLPMLRETTATPATLPALRQRRVNATLWAAGVGVGLVTAGAVAYIVLRNRIGAQSDEDTIIEIPLTSPAPSSGVTPSQAANMVSAVAANEGPAIVEKSPTDEEPRVAEPLSFSEDDAEGATFVGNIHSRVYHAIGSKHLPAPQHRIYFATEAEAVEAGYRPDSADMAPHNAAEASGPLE